MITFSFLVHVKLFYRIVSYSNSLVPLSRFKSTFLHLSSPSASSLAKVLLVVCRSNDFNDVTCQEDLNSFPFEKWRRPTGCLRLAL